MSPSLALEASLASALRGSQLILVIPLGDIIAVTDFESLADDFRASASLYSFTLSATVYLVW